MLLAVEENDKTLGIVTKTDILQALKLRRPSAAIEAEGESYEIV
jgi:hypothetical protein